MVVKLFTTIGSWLVNVLRNMLRICQDIPEELLRKSLEIVPRKFPGIGSGELFAGNSQEVPQILSTFSPIFLHNW